MLLTLAGLFLLQITYSQNPLIKDIFDFSPGDTLEYTINANFTSPHFEQQVIIQKDSAANTLSYVIAIHSTWNWSTDTFVTVINNCNDTFTASILNYACFYPGEDSICDYYDSTFIDSACQQLKSYGKWRNCLQAAYSHSVYQTGLGLVNDGYFCNFQGGIHYSRKLSYYHKKNGSQCGQSSGLFNSIFDIPKLNALIFPNPANDYFEITFPAEDPSPLTLQLFDSNGLMVKQQLIEQSPTIIDCKNLSCGLYLWKLAGAQKTALGKLIVLRN